MDADTQTVVSVLQLAFDEGDGTFDYDPTQAICYDSANDRKPSSPFLAAHAPFAGIWGGGCNTQDWGNASPTLLMASIVSIAVTDTARLAANHLTTAALTSVTPLVVEKKESRQRKTCSQSSTYTRQSTPSTIANADSKPSIDKVAVATTNVPIATRPRASIQTTHAVGSSVGRAHAATAAVARATSAHVFCTRRPQQDVFLLREMLWARAVKMANERLKWRTTKCSNEEFMRCGICPYGRKCRFWHHTDQQRPPPSENVLMQCAVDYYDRLCMECRQ